MTLQRKKISDIVNAYDATQNVSFEAERYF